MSDSTGRLEMQVGILVAAGMVATVLLVLISDSISFEGSYRVAVILDDAAGLNPGSPVKLDGLTIGHIESITSYQDPVGRGSILAETVIDQAFDIDEAAVVHRKTDGIFGDGHLAFSNPAKPSGRLLPKNDSAEVVAAESFFDEATVHAKEIVASMRELLGAENRANIGRLLAASATLAEGSSELVKDLRSRSQQIGVLATKATTLINGLSITQADVSERTAHSLQELDKTLASLRLQIDAVGKASTTLAGSADRVIGKADRLLSESQTDLATIRRDAKVMAGLFRGLAQDIADGRGVLGQLIVNSAMARDVNNLLISGEQLAERVADDPSILVWGVPPEDRDLARDHRDAAKLRRAFMEGFDRNPPVEFQHGRPSAEPEPAATEPVVPAP